MKKWLILIALLLLTCVFFTYKHIQSEKVNEQLNRQTIEIFLQNIKLGRMFVFNDSSYMYHDLQTAIYDKEGKNNLAVGPAAIRAIENELSNTKKVNKDIAVIDNNQVKVTGIIDEGKSLGFEEVYTFKNGRLVYFECNNNIEINE